MPKRLAPATILAFYLIAAMAAQAAGNPKTPTFYARHDYPGICYFVQAADTNGDGIPDLIVDGNGYVVVQFGNGDGTFRTGPLSHPGGAYFAFAASDLNGDGAADLILTGGNSIIVSMGNGDGTFPAGVTYPIKDGNVTDLVLGDFNGDGIVDIATGGSTGIWLLTGKGGGLFNPAVLAVPITGALNLAMADFNRDGNQDLVATRLIGSAGDGFAVALGNGDGTFQSPQTFSVPMRPLAVAAGSLTKGGPPGIAVNVSFSNDVLLYFGNGKGGFSGPRVVDLPGTNSSGLAIGDINGDGLPDLVSESGYVAYGVGLGYFSKPISYPIEPALEISNVLLADLRNNGKLDIVTGGYAAVSVLLNEGQGVLEDGIWTSVTGGAGCGAKADFNGDGKPDLAVNTPSGISILLGTAKYATPFTAGENIALAGAGCPVAGDFNGDGKVDLLVPVNNGTVVTYLNNGDGTFTLQSTTVTPTGGYLVLGDFNHDGKLDFATSGNLLALGNGDGTFQAPVDIVASPPSTGFSGIAAGDINKDGWTDLVLTNNAVPYNNVFVLLNNHRNGFTQVATTFGALSNDPILADLNGDGNLDLVLSYTALRYAGGGDALGASIYLGNGAGGFTYTQTLAAASAPSLNLVADVNGDGIPDIGVLQYDTLEIYLGEAGGTYATPFSIGTGPSPGSILVENLHGQTLKASLPDIVVPDTSGGVMVLLNLTQ